MVAGKLTRRAEKRLVMQARSGCEDAARALVDAHSGTACLRSSGGSCGTTTSPRRSAREAFLRAFDALDTFSAEFRFSTWLFTIAYRLCLNQIRRRKSVTGDLDFARCRRASRMRPTVLPRAKRPGG